MAIPQILRNFNPNKSVFNRRSYTQAIGDADNNGYAVIKIKPENARAGFENEDPTIIGVLRTDSEYAINFNVEANWSELGNVGASVLPGFSNLIQEPAERVAGAGTLLGISDIKASFASKLIYQNSGRLVISPQMRVVDWNGTGQPIFTAQLIAAYCLPRTGARLGKELSENIKSWTDKGNEMLKDWLTRQTETVNDISNTARTKVNEGGQILKKFTRQIGDTIDQVAGQGYTGRVIDSALEDVDDLSTLRASPVPVEIIIGKYFRKTDMVITNANISFSKEVTDAGPLYVDISLDLKSRKIMTDFEDVGLNPAKRKRAYVMNKGSNATG